MDAQNLLKIKSMPMPFGKYKGTSLLQLPEPYLVWFASKGFPPGELGKLLALVLEIKINGLESMVKNLDAKR